jgi:hypothetical protein
VGHELLPHRHPHLHPRRGVGERPGHRHLPGAGAGGPRVRPRPRPPPARGA